MFSKVADYYYKQMHDAEMDELVGDLVDVFHDLEWYDSGDIDADAYYQTIRNFKQKWFKSDRADRLKEVVLKKLEETKEDLLRCIG